MGAAEKAKADNEIYYHYYDGPQTEFVIGLTSRNAEVLEGVSKSIRDKGLRIVKSYLKDCKNGWFIASYVIDNHGLDLSKYNIWTEIEALLDDGKLATAEGGLTQHCLFSMMSIRKPVSEPVKDALMA